MSRDTSQQAALRTVQASFDAACREADAEYSASDQSAAAGDSWKTAVRAAQGQVRAARQAIADGTALRAAQADREAAARREREPRPAAILRADMARVIRDLDVPGYTEPEADREAGG